MAKDHRVKMRICVCHAYVLVGQGLYPGKLTEVVSQVLREKKLFYYCILTQYQDKLKNSEGDILNLSCLENRDISDTGLMGNNFFELNFHVMPGI